MPIISCRDLCVRYEHGFAVKDVGFDLEAGDYLCVIGENGSGKSTLIKGLLGLVKLSGDISFSGIKRTEIGYLSQQTAIQKDFPANVLEVVLSGRLGRLGPLPFYSRADKERAIENMEKLGIAELGKISYRELSGGQQRRVLLARALCAAEKLLLLDEPAAGLDPTATSSLYSQLEALNRENGVTIIMISHDIESAIKHCGKILHLRTSPLFFGETGDYLSSPYAARMLGSGCDA